MTRVGAVTIIPVIGVTIFYTLLTELTTAPVLKGVIVTGTAMVTAYATGVLSAGAPWQVRIGGIPVAAWMTTVVIWQMSPVFAAAGIPVIMTRSGYDQLAGWFAAAWVAWSAGLCVAWLVQHRNDVPAPTPDPPAPEAEDAPEEPPVPAPPAPEEPAGINLTGRGPEMTPEEADAYWARPRVLRSTLHRDVDLTREVSGPHESALREIGRAAPASGDAAPSALVPAGDGHITAKLLTIWPSHRGEPKRFEHLDNLAVLAGIGRYELEERLINAGVELVRGSARAHGTGESTKKLGVHYDALTDAADGQVHH